MDAGARAASGNAAHESVPGGAGLLYTGSMSDRAPLTLRTVLGLFGYGVVGLGALLTLDFKLRELLVRDAARLIRYARMPVETLAPRPSPGLEPAPGPAPARDQASGPRHLRGRLFGPPERVTPTGQRSAMWVGWVTRTRKSGRNTYEDTVCEEAELDGLQLVGSRAPGSLDDPPMASLALFKARADFTLVHDSPLESSSSRKVLVDMGRRVNSGSLPPLMKQRCGYLVWGKTTYHESSIEVGTEIDVIACRTETPEGVELVPCADRRQGPAALSARGLAPVVRAFGNEILNPLRLTACVLWVVLGLLAGTLLKWSEARAAKPAPRRREHDGLRGLDGDAGRAAPPAGTP